MALKASSKGGLTGKKKTKTLKKLQKLSNKGRLKRGTKDKLNALKTKSQEPSMLFRSKVELDVLDNYQLREEQQENDIYGRDSDQDNMDQQTEEDNIATTSVKKAARTDDYESIPRRFNKNSHNEDSMKAMLPTKEGGRVVTRFTKIEQNPVGMDVDAEEEREEQPMSEEEDYGSLSAVELLAKRQQLIHEHKRTMAQMCRQLTIDPQANVHKLRELVLLAVGKSDSVHSLVRGTVQKLATVSLGEIFVDIIPGYRIRELSEAETGQKMKKETKHLSDFESALLRNYGKFVTHLEKTAKIVTNFKATAEISEGSLGFIGAKIICRLMNERPHFNLIDRLIASVVPLASSNDLQVRSYCCRCIRWTFENDCTQGEISLSLVRSISRFVKDSPAVVKPQLLEALLALKIHEVEKRDANSRRKEKEKKKEQLKAMSKKERKYQKQLSLLDQEFEEADAESVKKSKLRNNTLTMEQVFWTYFRVLKRWPSLTDVQASKTAPILAPVLEGVSKFAHLINVDFMDDLIASIHAVLETPGLKLLDSLHCIHAVFVILSGEGSLLNLDPQRFYKQLYTLLPKMTLENDQKFQEKQFFVALKVLDIMLVQRRKQISLCRFAAFVKRLSLLSLILRTELAVAVLAALRTYFVANPKLECLLDVDSEDACHGGAYQPSLDDPDHCNALSGGILDELALLSERNANPVLRSLCLNLSAKLTSKGKSALSSQLAQSKPWDLIGEMLKRQGTTRTDIEATNLGKRVRKGNICAALHGYVNENRQSKNSS